jgi:putative peptidoglycan lipid II flippase
MTGVASVPISRARLIVSSGVTFAALSLFPKVLAIAKDMAVAARFAAAQTLDTYLMAFVLIGIPVSVIAVSLQTALIPALVGKDGDGAGRLLGGALKLTLMLLALALPLWLLVLPLTLDLMYPRAEPSVREHLFSACLWLLPYYFINGCNLVLYGALQARKAFWPNALLPGLFPLAILACLWLMPAVDIRVLLAGTVAGSVCEGLALLLLLRRAGWLRLRNTAGAGLLKVVRIAAPLAAGMVFSNMSPVIEQLIAFRLGEGAVSLLNYGFKVPAALASLLVTAIGIVVLPHFAELIAQNAWRPCRTLYLRLAGIALAGGLAIASVGVVFSEAIIRLLFERGAFTASHTAEAAAVMRMYLLQLPFLLAAMVAIRLLAALGKTATMTTITAAQVLFASWFAYALSERLGVAGVALGTAAAASAGAVMFGWAAWTSLNHRIIEEEGA